MDCQQTPQFSEESLKELTQILVEFFRNNLPEEALSDIEVEIRYKPSSQDGEALAQQPKPRPIVYGGCIEGEWDGSCPQGMHWAMARPPASVE